MIRVAKLSANWNNDSKADGFNWNVNNAPSNRNRNISRRLAHVRMNQGFIPVSDKIEYQTPCPLAKYKNYLSQGW